MELTGKVKKIFDPQTFDSGFKKRELVITTEENYPQDIIIEFLQDKSTLLDSLNLGDVVKVSINIRGREWINPQGEAKYFNSLNGWKLEKLVQDSSSSYSDMPPAPPVVNDFPAEARVADEEDDLPF